MRERRRPGGLPCERDKGEWGCQARETKREGGGALCKRENKKGIVRRAFFENGLQKIERKPFGLVMQPLPLIPALKGRGFPQLIQN